VIPHLITGKKRASNLYLAQVIVQQEEILLFTPMSGRYIMVVVIIALGRLGREHV